MLYSTISIYFCNTHWRKNNTKLQPSYILLFLATTLEFVHIHMYDVPHLYTVIVCTFSLCNIFTMCSFIYDFMEHSSCVLDFMVQHLYEH